jgi:hypothetical protein
MLRKVTIARFGKVILAVMQRDGQHDRRGMFGNNSDIAEFVAISPTIVFLPSHLVAALKLED